ncbi:decaprenyl-phosphate phosphoribosyltransferase [Patescibacteria group bacterium]|nr:decaprenyl-phosphate phosphoribosyltransferase [Patescibacteria group bacterium]
MAVSQKINLIALAEALRPVQWIKNLSLFAAAILTGQMLDPAIFSKTLLAFVVFCLLSSSSYLVNDLIDVKNDRLHPNKKNRPIARGDLSQSTALFFAFILFLSGVTFSSFINPSFFLLSLIFIFLQYLYSLFLKKKAILDIIGISVFFIFRVYAGEVASGYHLPIWVTLTVIFLSLFIASGKRRSELVKTGTVARLALNGYGENLLNFYTTMFAVCTLITYAMFTFFEEPVRFQGLIHNFLLEYYPPALDRKWFMITLAPVIFGIMRYGQIIFEMQEGEKPERIISTDIPLIFSILTWGSMIVVIIYVL